MKKTEIAACEAGSLAEQAGLQAGDVILSINGEAFSDVLEYRYLTAEAEVELSVRKKNGDLEDIIIENDYEDLGIEFSSGLIDDAQSCRNKCIFCFIDQLPPGMRETVYFKDDDTRLSFLQGNYVTLTNLKEEDINRLIRMRVSPINISVHTTNPELRKKMLHNRFAGDIYEIMKRFSAHEMYMNTQIVLCPGYNDKKELDRTIADLAALFPYVNSLSVVPVGLTRYREGLCKLEPFTPETAKEVVLQVSAWQRRLFRKNGSRLVYLSDEFYLMAGMPIPDAEEYEGFPQLENGVGLISSMQEEFDAAIRLIPQKTWNRTVTMATGELAYPFISGLAKRIEAAAPGIRISVYAVKNDFFGGGVNVAGLVCGNDLIRQLQDKPKTDLMTIPSVMLRDGEDIFLDDVLLKEAEIKLQMPIVPVNNDGYELIEAIIGEELAF